MTGFGRGVTTTNNYQITVEARSVNHRFLEVGLKFPKEFLEVEAMAKKIVSNQTSRGKIDLHLSIKELHEAPKTIRINWALLEAYQAVKQQLSSKVSLQQNWTMEELVKIDQMLLVENEQLAMEDMTEWIQNATKKAIDQLVQMREREGQELKSVMLQLKNQLQDEIIKIKECSSEVVLKYRNRLLERIKEVAENEHVEARVLAEVALFAERVDITEELDRMESHIVQLEEIMQESEAIGRKLEFLMQEMHREINTIGSKNQSSKCSVAVVQAKMILEKMREQVQNIE